MTQILVSVLSSLRALGCCFGCLAGFAGSSFGTAGGYGTLLPPATSFVLAARDAGVAHSVCLVTLPVTSGVTMP